VRSLEQTQARFVEETSKHQLTVLRDDGLYRHLRCQRPETWCYGFNVVTWPGYLAIVGDMGDYVFSRIPDMFEFFENSRGEINPSYWAEKLQAPPEDQATVYSVDLYRARALEWLKDTTEDLERDQAERLTAAVNDDLLAMPPLTHDEAIRRLIDFECAGTRICEPYEWRLKEFDSKFLWCCHAIVWAIGKYRERPAAVAA
jgi:hypothetical protein